MQIYRSRFILKLTPLSFSLSHTHTHIDVEDGWMDGQIDGLADG